MSKNLANFVTHEVLNSEVLKGGRRPNGGFRWPGGATCKDCKRDNKDR